jgi:hypothetical protein
MSRIFLKAYATLISELRFNASATERDSEKAKYKVITDDAKKARLYGADGEYVNLIKIGPTVDGLVDGVAALEQQIAHLHAFVSGQLGDGADDVVLPPSL